MRTTARLLVAGLLVAEIALSAAPAGGPYDPSVDAWQQLEAAGRRAAGDGHRILAVVGGNWCKWCRALDGLMASDPALRGELASHWDVVHVNVSKENKNPAAMERLGNPDKHGFPVLVVLSPSLEVLHTQETSALEADGGAVAHDPAKVLAFLEEWASAR